MASFLLRKPRNHNRLMSSVPKSTNSSKESANLVKPKKRVLETTPVPEKSVAEK